MLSLQCQNPCTSGPSSFPASLTPLSELGPTCLRRVLWLRSYSRLSRTPVVRQGGLQMICRLARLLFGMRDTPPLAAESFSL